MTAAVGRATGAPSGAPAAALYYEDEHALRRQRTVEHLGDMGLRVTKIVHVDNAGSPPPVGLAGIDLVICMEDQLGADVLKSILGRARANDLPCFAIRHPRTHASWRYLEKFLDPKGSSAPPPPVSLTAKLPLPRVLPPPTMPRIVPPPRSSVADSVAETEELAAMYQAEADDLKRSLQERDDRITHLEAELQTAKQQHGDAIVRERLAADLAAARADRTKALRDAEDLTARLGAAERERAEIERALLDLQKSRAEPAPAPIAPPAPAPAGPSTWEVRARSLVNAWGVGALTADEALERIRRIE